jgi:hypothetical protein
MSASALQLLALVVATSCVVLTITFTAMYLLNKDIDPSNR